MHDAERYMLRDLFWQGIGAVSGDCAVAHWVTTRNPSRPSRILAVGKAAVSMFQGLPEDWRNGCAALVVTKTGHLEGALLGANVTALETAHPVPDDTSLAAGRKVVAFVESCQPGERLLMLVSGGASSMVEHLRDGVGLGRLVAITSGALAEGADIEETNRRRNTVSAIKGGRLLSRFRGAQVDVLAISDVAGDGVDVIGSGLGAYPGGGGFQYRSEIVASNAIARRAVAAHAATLGLPLMRDAETLYGDVGDVARTIASEINQGADGLYLFGGEPTVVLPDNPGLGGRNQTLALLLARHFTGRGDVVGLVAGTDGTDGPTDATGAFFDGRTYVPGPASEALRCANSAVYLAQTGDRFVTGPTGTNVMDLALILKGPEVKPPGDGRKAPM